MKTILSAAVAVALLAGTSCYINTMETIYGNGQVVSEERDIGDFEGLKVSSGIDVLIRQGSEAALMLEADENLHEVIRTEVVDGNLKIYTSMNVRRANKMTVYLVYKELNSIRVSSSGDVRGENTLHTERLRIGLSSAGDLTLDVEAEKVICDISSSGDVRLSGSTDLLEASLSSAGDLYAYDLNARTCDVNVSSAGDARVYASEEFKLRSSSAGSIYYKGEGKLVYSSTSSAGSISRR
jgi:hypothetical protein